MKKVVQEAKKYIYTVPQRVIPGRATVDVSGETENNHLPDSLQGINMSLKGRACCFNESLVYKKKIFTGFSGDSSVYTEKRNYFQPRVLMV